jgi:hypothetical protein
MPIYTCGIMVSIKIEKRENWDKGAHVFFIIIKFDCRLFWRLCRVVVVVGPLLVVSLSLSLTVVPEREAGALSMSKFAYLKKFCRLGVLIFSGTRILWLVYLS